MRIYQDIEMEKFITDQLEVEILNFMGLMLDKGDWEISEESKVQIKEKINEWNMKYCNKYKEKIRSWIKRRSKTPWMESRQFSIIMEMEKEIDESLKIEYIVDENKLRNQMNGLINNLAKENSVYIYTNLESMRIEMARKFTNMKSMYNEHEKVYIKAYIREKQREPQPQFGEFHRPIINYLKEQFEHYFQ